MRSAHANCRSPGLTGLPQYQLDGDFTLHGVARPIAGGRRSGGAARLDSISAAAFSLVQSQFGITPFTKAFGAVGVADEVKVFGDLWIASQRQEVAAAAPPANR